MLLCCQVSHDRVRGPAGGQLGHDPVAQHTGHRKLARTRTSQRYDRRLVCNRWPIPEPATVAPHFASHGRGMSTDLAAQLRPRNERCQAQREADFLAIKQRQRQSWHSGISNGRFWLQAPTIMAGTVHRPLELPDLTDR
jgi:hypothetical protein